MTIPTPPPGGPVADPLEEVRQRLAALDDVPLERHPAEFDALDGLLRAALDGARGDGVPAPPR